MLGLISSELLFYGGIVIMTMTVLLTVVCIVLFKITGQKLKVKLEQEYGETRR